MKIIPLKKLLLNNTPLKIVSFLLGYSFWYIASLNQVVTHTIEIPLCFNSIQKPYTINAPETINVTLQGKRSDLHTIDKETLAAHINIDKLSPGKYGIILTEQHLFLPNTLSLIHYCPANISITIKNQTI